MRVTLSIGFKDFCVCVDIASVFVICSMVLHHE